MTAAIVPSIINVMAGPFKSMLNGMPFNIIAPSNAPIPRIIPVSVVNSKKPPHLNLSIIIKTIMRENNLPYYICLLMIHSYTDIVNVCKIIYNLKDSSFVQHFELPDLPDGKQAIQN